MTRPEIERGLLAIPFIRWARVWSFRAGAQVLVKVAIPWWAFLGLGLITYYVKRCVAAYLRGTLPKGARARVRIIVF